MFTRNNSASDRGNMQVRVLSILNLIGFLATLIINFLANWLPLNDVSTGQVSADYPTLFTPAGFTFGIWGLIYLFLLFFTIYQLNDAWRYDGQIVRQIGPMFIFASIANCTWIFAWHYYYLAWSLLIIFFLLASLIIIYLSLDIGERPVPKTKKYFVNTVFSIYLGWVSIAVIANTAIWLTNMEWGGFGIDPRFWTLIVLWLGVSIAGFLLSKRGDFAFVMVVIWALIGILVQRLNDGFDWKTAVVLGPAAGIVYLLYATGTRLIR